MSNVTPQEVLSAASVLRAVPRQYHDPEGLEEWAAKLERDQAEAKRRESLAQWLYENVGNRSASEWELMSKPNHWHDRAEELMKAYPELAEVKADVRVQF